MQTLILEKCMLRPDEELLEPASVLLKVHHNFFHLIIKDRGGGIAGRQYGADRNFKDEIKSPTENEPWDIPTTITGSFGSNGVFGFDAGSKNDIELEKLVNYYFVCFV